MKKCCCLTTIIVFVLIIAILCVGLFVLTPNMIGLGDTVISDGKTLNDLGLGDVTIFEVLKTLSQLSTQKDPNEVLGDDAYNDDDLQSASNSLGIEKDEGGNIDYSEILSGTSINKSGVTVTLSDKEFAAIANDILDYLVENPSESTGGEQMSDLFKNVNIYQLSPEVTNSSTGDVNLTATVGVSVKDLLGDSAQEGPLNQVIQSLPDELIITMTVPMDNTSDGYVFDDDEVLQNVKINGQEIELVNDIINNIELGEGENKQTITDMLHGSIGDGISALLNEWGVTLGNGSVTIAPAL